MSDPIGGRLRKAWLVHVKGYDTFGTFYAPTAGKARAKVWYTLWDVGNIRIVDVIARRAPWADVALPERDPMADQMSEQERHCLLHAYGVDCGDPTKAGYRDYFYTYRDDPPLVSLTKRGLMAPMPGDKFGENMTYFVLTNEGKRVALSMVPEYAQ